MPWIRPPRIDALAKGRERRTGGESEGPMPLAGHSDPAELECDPAKHQRQQHDDDRQIERRQNDRIGQREGDHHAGAAEHEPRLVAVPERRDGIHHLVALVLGLGERKQDADSEIEAVEDHVHRDREPDDRGPDDRQIRFHGAASHDVLVSSQSLVQLRRRFAAASRREDRAGAPQHGRSTAEPCGPRAISRLM